MELRLILAAWLTGLAHGAVIATPTPTVTAAANTLAAVDRIWAPYMHITEDIEINIHYAPTAVPYTAPAYTSVPLPPAYQKKNSTTTCAVNSKFTNACRYETIPGCVPCEGQPGKDPAKWCGFDINTDYYNFTPHTCRRAVCTLEVTNATVAPDGVSRQALVTNGQLPGPLLEANWGDEVQVTIKNSMSMNGTTIHFHGQRQKGTPFADGVASITQCPIPGDGGSQTYVFTAQLYGSSWWHSHYSLQAWDGVSGPMVIHGPSSAPYDIDLGPVVLQDWLHVPASQIFERVERTGQPDQDNILINGHAILPAVGGNSTTNGTSPSKAAVGSGSFATFKFTPKKTHRLRLVNTAIDSVIAFSIDNHTMTVIAADYIPVTPFKATTIKLSPAQRYDVLVTADQDASSYWLRADPMSTVNQASGLRCSSLNANAGNTRAIIQYDSQNTCSNPDESSVAHAHDESCDDEVSDLLVPVFKMNSEVPEISINGSVVIAKNATTNIFRWYLSGSTFQANYSSPTLLQVAAANSKSPTAINDIIKGGPHAIATPNKDEWVHLIINSPQPLPHPIHLHGHDFLVLGSGNGTYNGQPLKTANPPRRDTAQMPAAGWLVLAWKTDNPGVWLMHCHVGWHQSMGFAVEFVERAAEIPQFNEAGTGSDNGTYSDYISKNPRSEAERNCRAWDQWSTKIEPLLGIDDEV